VSQIGSQLKLGALGAVRVGGFSLFNLPSVKPAYIGVGYVIGPRLAALNFAGGVLGWGLLIPLILFFQGPQLAAANPELDWTAAANQVWRNVIRPIGVGGMLAGAAFTLFRMRKNLGVGLARAFAELRGPAIDPAKLARHERYMSSKLVIGLIAVTFVFMCALYIWFAGQALGGLVAAVAMLVVGFFFATVSGYLVGVIGSSNNPISGLTLSTLIIAALLMVALGVSGAAGVAAVLGVAAVVCVSSAVAGELLQDFKVGWFLGGTPRTIQIVELVAVVVASLVMYFPLMVLHEGDLQAGGQGFGGAKMPAPQAGLMASLAQGIVGGDMQWPLVITGLFLGAALIMMQVKSPMLIAVGLYLPLGTTFAIFVGGMFRWLTDSIAERRAYTAGQRARIENLGILIASGMITGEGLMGLVEATVKFYGHEMPVIFPRPDYWLGALVILLLGGILTWFPLRNPGSPDEAAPPSMGH
jgi:putative OPT family oligopeptide transporter